jgi:hypothetical protein
MARNLDGARMTGRVALATVVALLLCLLTYDVAAAGGPQGCQGRSNARDGAYWLRCDSRAHHTTGGPLGQGNGGPAGRTYVYEWLPSCPGAWPGVPGAEEMNCRGAHRCTDPKLLSLSLFSQVVDGTGHALTAWRYMRSECRKPSNIGKGQPRHTLTWADVRAAIKRIGVPPAIVEAPDYTLVNLRTTFYTHVPPFDRTLSIIGFVVDVHITPVRYIWHWGDGSTTTTHTPGRPYPARDVTHTYRHATDPDETVPIRVDVAYQASFRVDGGDWVSVNDQLIIEGATLQLPVKQASAVLVPSS